MIINDIIKTSNVDRFLQLTDNVEHHGGAKNVLAISADRLGALN